MIPLALEDIAALVGGAVHDAPPDTVVTGPAFVDTRTPEPGGLFAAFAGERTDGHAHAAQARAAGAAAVLGSRPTGEPTVVVDDVRSALQVLAREVVARLRMQGGLRHVHALTGSQGKTSAKDLLGAVLTGDGPTVATAASFNNELGMPLTALRADATTRHLVLEMGARGIGHLADLCGVVRPDVSVVLNVGTAHLGEFGSRANIARAKGELVEALDPEGVAVLNADDPLVAAMASRTRGRVRTFGTGPDADVRLVDLRLDDLSRPAFTLVADDASAGVRLQVLGAHQALNAAAVAAAATATGMPLADVAHALSEVRALSRWRMELRQRPDGLAVVNDAYNANPESVRAALETLAELGRRSGRRTVAVLGEMRELGEDSERAHAEVGALLDELGIDEAIVVGPDAAAVRGRTTRHVEGVDEAVSWLRQNVRGTDVVLVKASRAARLERVAEALVPDGTGQEATR
ncbi:MAG: UDP-N-acetylmuramoyl-tripeptide--D-alanyl-D-alanine ligase [Marmoricola sp.]